MTSARPYRRRKAQGDRCLPAARPAPPRSNEAPENAPGVESERIPRETSPPAQPPPRKVRVTAHAVLRYLERFEGVDTASAAQRLKSRLDAGRAAELLDFGGTSSFRVRVGGATYVFRHGRIVTCYP